MDRTKVIELAREAGFQSPRLEDKTDYFMLERFAALVAAHEREQCALVCDAVAAEEREEPVHYGFGEECAAAIRARGEISQNG